MSDRGGPTIYAPVRPRRGSHSHVHAKGRRRVCCAHTHTSNRTRFYGGLTLHHPWNRNPSPAWFHQPPHPWNQADCLVLFQPPLGARPREEQQTPRASPACSSRFLRSANLQRLPCALPLPWGERGGVPSPKLAPTRRCGQKVRPLQAQTPCIIFCADFRQWREEQSCTFQVAGETLNQC